MGPLRLLLSRHPPPRATRDLLPRRVPPWDPDGTPPPTALETPPSASYSRLATPARTPVGPRWDPSAYCSRDTPLRELLATCYPGAYPRGTPMGPLRLLLSRHPPPRATRDLLPR